MEGLAGLGGMPPGAGGGAAEPKDDGKLIDLSSTFEKNECYARNEQSGFPFTNLFIGDSRLGCKSDTDEQLIIQLSFQEFVKIKSIKFTEFNQGVDPELNPTTIRLFANRENLGFEDIEDVSATQVINLDPDTDLKESADPIMLKYVKFQRVKTLTIFIEDNNGGEVSALGSIKLMGRTMATVNMSEFKKNPNQQG